MWCWRKLLRIPWTARRSNQSILKEISPGCSLEGLMLKLKLQHWPTDVKSWHIWKDLDAGKDRRQEEKGATEDEMFGWHHWLNGHEFEQTLGDGEGLGNLVCCTPWGLQGVRHDWVTEQFLMWNRKNFWYPSLLMGFLGGTVVNNLSANAGDMGSIPRLGWSPRLGNGNPYQ